MRRTPVIVSALLIAAAVSASSARGALFLMFSGTQAEPGERVFVQTGGRGALPNIATSAALRVFLVPAKTASEVTSSADRRLIPLGQLRVDDEGNGYLHFVVPDVPPGEYTTFIRCVPCARNSAGRALVPGGPWVGSFVVRRNGRRFPLLLILLGAGAAAVALGGTLAWKLSRRTDLACLREPRTTRRSGRRCMTVWDIPGPWLKQALCTPAGLEVGRGP